MALSTKGATLPCVLTSYPGSPTGVYEGHQKMVEEHFEIVWYEQYQRNPEKYADVIQGIFCYCFQPTITEELVKSLPKLKVVSVFGVGYEFINLNVLRKYGIRLGNSPKLQSDTVADAAILLMLASARNMIPGLQKAANPALENFDRHIMGVDVYGATIGIIGMGDIGYAIAERAKAFSMEILYRNRIRRSAIEEERVGAVYCDLEELLRMSDFVMLATPLTEETRGLIGQKEFGMMKSTATIINIGRGACIDQDALVEALQNKSIRGAALDVTYPEPLPRDHPLLKLSNVIITPHSGSQTYTTSANSNRLAIDNLIAGIEGKPMPAEVKL